MRIGIEPVVDGELAEDFYQLYLAAFEPLRTRAVARQVLHREEFLAEMVDPRIEKYVARDDTGYAIGLSTMTRHLETVPWISPEYFAARYPEHAARNAIFYIGFTLTRPGQRGPKLAAAMIDALVETLLPEQAVVAYDICSYNDTRLRFGTNIASFFRRTAEVTVEPVDAQTYYSATFHGARGSVEHSA